jgi:hypothetical protein
MLSQSHLPTSYLEEVRDQHGSGAYGPCVVEVTGAGWAYGPSSAAHVPAEAQTGVSMVRVYQPVDQHGSFALAMWALVTAQAPPGVGVDPD